jgi:hypothetical protein
VIQLPETLRPALGSRGQARLFGREEVGSEATLRQLADAADPMTRTFEARYVLTGALQDAPLGATVTVQVADEFLVSKPSLQVPIGALFDAGQGPGVWVLQGEPATVAWRPVTVLQLDDDLARVSGQLQREDRIVALGAHLLHGGELVRVAAPFSTSTGEGARP